MKATLFTYQDYLNLEEDKRYEVLEGELIEMPAPSTVHQKIIWKLSRFFMVYQEEKGLGDFYLSPVDVILAEDVVVQPDIVFISKDRLDIVKDKGIFGAPDLVVEVVSPSTFKKDTEDKRRIYAQFGIKEFWLVFPEERGIEVLELKNGVYEVVSYAFEKGKVCSKILEGLCIELEEVFL
ncbi:MAG: Uma2 family endonuclease [Aquificota bacterium]|nr:MAG: Uma2 family endonuclease [Aquificota bacterium]